ncbi:MAG: peptidyl-dipeptidase Dcp, partial [Glaciecola sp.]
MKKALLTLSAVAIALSIVACSDKPSEFETGVSEAAATQGMDNALLAEFSGPYNGVPAFDRMSLADLKPALEKGMELNLAEIDKITANPERPTFANTIVEMERAGSALSRVFTYYSIWGSNNSTPEFRKIQQEMAPVISAFSSKITQNKSLFERVQAVYKSDELKTLTTEEQRVTWMTYNGFTRNGATLNDEDKKRYADINQELASLHTQFSNNILADEENYVLYLNQEQLAGLPESFVSAAAGMADIRDNKGKYAITNTRSSMDPFLTYSEDRALREKVWNTYYSRGDNGDEFDNNELVKKILTLRHERITLLGYDNYAQWRLEDRMAKTPERAMDLMEKVWPAAIARVKEEVTDMQAIADAEGASISIEPWDYRFYAEKVRKDKYALDSDEVKQYLQLGKLREAMFFVAGELFNFDFAPVAEGKVPVFNADVKVWDVTDKTSGEHIGLWYLDPFARQGKRSGAWAS